MSAGLAAFRSVDFGWVRPLQSVWHDPPFHVETLHQRIVEDVLDDFLKLKRPNAITTEGHVVVGPPGSGKTHLVGSLRKRVWEEGGWFVLLDIVGITDFWRTAALGFINSLQQIMPDGQAQHTHVFLRVLKSLPPAAIKSVAKEIGGIERGNPVRTADLMVGLLQAAHPAHAARHRDIVRAFILLHDADTFNAAYSWLQGLELDPADLRELRFAGQPPAPAEMVRGMAWFMSLAGPILIAADQLDAIVTAANLVAGSAAETSDESERKARSIIEMLAGGLMDLKDVATRSMTVVTCLVDTWDVLRRKALQSAAQRFVGPHALQNPKDKAVARRMIGDRLAAAYEEKGFVPPYPTWPFRPEAIDGAVDMAPRQMLMRADAHRRRCMAAGAVSECSSLVDGGSPEPPAQTDDWDARLAAARRSADIAPLLRPDDDSRALRELLAEMLDLYVRQTRVPEDVDLVVHRDPDERKPTLHGRVTFTFHGEHDREQHYCFRVLTQAHHLAFQARLRAAMTASGIEAGLPFRHLAIIRMDPPLSGKVTAGLVSKMQRAGGRFIQPAEDDLRTFLALRHLRDAGIEGFDAWLHAAQPLCRTSLFRDAGLCPPPVSVQAERKEAASGAVSGNVGAAARRLPSETVPAQRDGAVSSFHEARNGSSPVADGGTATRRTAPDAGDAAEPKERDPKSTRTRHSAAAAIPVGRRLEAGGEGREESLPADLLPRHTAIIAGAGSGKTVLLRRLVEEAALAGIPAIVVDVNNDLARLDEPWPERPPEFNEADAAKAGRYFAEVETIVWTPGLPGGNPLSLSLLPDFAALDDEDEREEAVQMARVTLLPFVGATGSRGALKEGVLADALRAFARRGGRALKNLTEFLDDLPEDASRIDGADNLARDMANQLKAKVATNPLLRAGGPGLDPAALFEGTDGRTRISVVNLSGLAEDAQQNFVNQLQMTLFGWIKQNPSRTGRLYVLDEAQVFAPSGRATPASESARALAAQARKYGLGMLLATQLPKGIDNRIVGNCTTQFYRRQSAPVTIQAARDMLAARGGTTADDIGRLSRAQFYFSTEGYARPVKLRTPLCLSHHPANPLTSDEVAMKARASRLAP